MTSNRKPTRELAERRSNGTLIRLLWVQGTRELWVEVREPEVDVAIVIRAEPERALEVFLHPYAYAPESVRDATWQPTHRNLERL